MITIEEVETFDYAAGTVLEQTPAARRAIFSEFKNQDCLGADLLTLHEELNLSNTYDQSRGQNHVLLRLSSSCSVKRSAPKQSWFLNSENIALLELEFVQELSLQHNRRSQLLQS